MNAPNPIRRNFNVQTVKSEAEIKTRERGSKLIERANANFEKHSGAWINKRYGELLKSKAAPAPELHPHGLRPSVAERAHKAASMDVHNRHQNRIAGIRQKVERVIKNQSHAQGQTQKPMENQRKKNEIAR